MADVSKIEVCVDCTEPVTYDLKDNLARTHIEQLKKELINKIDKDYIYSLDSFTGNTIEDKLINALNTIEHGYIIIPNITVTKQYIPVKNKDYRKIQLMGGSFTVGVDNWWDNSETQGYFIGFNCCYIDTLNSYNMCSANTLVGPQFINCYIENLSLCHNTTYIQSLSIINCQYWNELDLLSCKQLYDCRIVNNRIESASGEILRVNNNDSFAIYNTIIKNNVIEGRRNKIPFVFTNCSNLCFDGNYFEDNAKGLIQQIGTSSVVMFTFRNNYVYEPNLHAHYIQLQNNNLYIDCEYNNINIPDKTVSLIQAYKINARSELIPLDRNYSFNRYNVYLDKSDYTNTLYTVSSGTYKYKTGKNIKNGCGIYQFVVLTSQLGSELYRGVALLTVFVGIGYQSSQITGLVKHETTQYKGLDFIKEKTDNFSVSIDTPTSLYNPLNINITFNDSAFYPMFIKPINLMEMFNITH